jgi:diaminohydroxyphosphoribosylaminopyrimidine deaminase/5-amino-6-(5-phosphoribosylamino)uracil reductase
VDNEVAMRRAIDLAARARFQAPPNPWVGCVLLRDGEVIAEGATEAPGGRHAEIVALDAAGDAACGATAVVTLEPCSHTGRTGPCADALIAAGVAAVVIAIEDPDPQVGGTGVAALAAAGIPVTTGVEADAVRAQLRSYLHHRTTGRPSVLWKTGMSLDGRSAARDGSAKWITGDAARLDVQTLRAASQAIIVGSGTAQSDLPALTVHATGAFSREHFDVPPDEVAGMLIDAVRPWIDGDPRTAVVERSIHRWKFATPTTILPDPFVAVSWAPPILCCGDAFAGPRVEGAFSSGVAAGTMLVGRLAGAGR